MEDIVNRFREDATSTASSSALSSTKPESELKVPRSNTSSRKGSGKSRRRNAGRKAENEVGTTVGNGLNTQNTACFALDTLNWLPCCSCIGDQPARVLLATRVLGVESMCDTSDRRGGLYTPLRARCRNQRLVKL